jgi:hypothetical protein
VQVRRGRPHVLEQARLMQGTSCDGLPLVHGRSLSYS